MLLEVRDLHVEFRTRDGVAKAVAKYVKAVVRCHTKAADAGLKGGTFDEELCESDPTIGKGAKEKYEAAIAKLLARMGVAEELAAQVRIRPDAEPRRAPLRSLFTEGRALGTSLLSVALFLTLLMAFFLVNWIPTLAIRSGIDISVAILGVAALNVGGILGSLVISRFADWRAPGMVISLGYALGAVAIACVGQAGRSGTWLLISAFVAGFLAIGAQMCMASLLAIYYDTGLRASGVGWGMGCGRVGGIIGPVIGGMLLAASVSTGAIFLIAGLVCAACAVTVFTMGRLVLRPRTERAAQLDVAPNTAPSS